MVSLFWKIAFHIVLIVCIGQRELDATQKWRIFVIVRKANSNQGRQISTKASAYPTSMFNPLRMIPIPARNRLYENFVSMVFRVACRRFVFIVSIWTWQQTNRNGTLDWLHFRRISYENNTALVVMVYLHCSVETSHIYREWIFTIIVRWRYLKSV